MWELKEYRVASSVAEALTLIQQGPGRGVFIAGGTDLFLDPPDCDFVVDINNAGFSDVALSPGGDLFVGAAATLQQVATNPLVRDFAGGGLARVAARCGNRPVRTTATIGGNLCSALPSGDMAPILLALDASCYLAGREDQESLPLEDFFLGPRQTVLEGRLLVGLSLPGVAADRRCAVEKLSRSAEDIALVQVAVAAGLAGDTLAALRIALGAVAPVPLRAREAEAHLEGLPLTAVTGDLIAEAADMAGAACEPISDHRAGAEYRRDMVRVLTGRLITNLLAQPEREEDL